MKQTHPLRYKRRFCGVGVEEEESRRGRSKLSKSDLSDKSGLFY